MVSKILPDPIILRQLLNYDPDTGNLFWRERGREFFNEPTDPRRTSKDVCSMWNTRYAGKQAFTSKTGHGCLSGSILGVPTTAHRVIWAIVHGQWPTGVIDHINGDPTDNRLVNLRQVSHKINGRNARLRSDNPSGFPGIKMTQSGRWQAVITVDGIRQHLGTFPTLEGAIDARRAHEARNGFHPNHGRRQSVLDSRHGEAV